MKRRDAKSKREKERYTRLDTQFQRIERRDKKAFLSIIGQSEVSQKEKQMQKGKTAV